jgi:hypothetical protein
MAKWPLDGKQACFCSFCLVCAAMEDGSCAPAQALRNGFTRPGMRARLPNAALQHCVMVDA